MFQSLSSSLKNVFNKIRSKGTITESDFDSIIREIRVALISADINIDVIKDLILRLKEEAIGQKIIKSITPDQMIIKFLNDILVDILSKENPIKNPRIILMAGLQGSGKTSLCGKLSHRYNKSGKKVMLASCDIYRPAAREQLKLLADATSAEYVCSEISQPLDIAKEALLLFKKSNADILIVDTAGRLNIDEELMKELVAIQDILKPDETILVADSMIGQGAVIMAKEFASKVQIDSIALSRIDGDSRGGAAISMAYVTNKPISYLGVGEKVSQLEEFSSERMANRILGMGDIVGLVEQAKESLDTSEMANIAKQMQSGKMDLNSYKTQLSMMSKMGGMSSLMSMIPGMPSISKEDIDSKSKDVKKHIAIIDSMTKKERSNPDILNAQRRIRIANGSGTSVEDINKLINQFKTMKKMSKSFFGGMKNKGDLMSKEGIENLMKNPSKLGGLLDMVKKKIKF
jgi:signal recognition particle subunit SRP54